MTPFASTYRVQLHAGFDFDAARQLVAYWRDLGIGACYSSPIFAAQAGSMHGYDVIDPSTVNPELGGRAAFDRLSAALRAEGIGLLLDIVPNHQAATTANPTWRELLAQGPESCAGRTFDIDWDAQSGQLVWPLLGESVDDEVRAGNLKLERAGEDAWELRYFDESLPVTGPVDDPNDVAGVLRRQYYTLTQWRAGERARNYRRFFDVPSLAGVRVGDEDVFRETHALLFELVGAGMVNGLRVDHIDGLADPRLYLDRLAAATSGIYTVIEKILARDEVVPADWSTAGTTGYEVCNEVLGLFVDPDGRAVLEANLLAENGGTRFDVVEHEAKREVLDQLFGAEWARVERALVETAKAAGVHGDHDALAAALRAVTIGLGVYRTYVGDGPARNDDRRRIEDAAEVARHEPGVDSGAVRVVADLLTGDAVPDGAREARSLLLRRWQQLTGPVMAKGHEDTACYRYPALLAQAEVGGDPGDDARDAVSHFQQRAAQRFERGERGLNTTSTHDTKRSEDVRARLAVLSERPREFEDALRAWRVGLGDLRGTTPVEQRFVAQTLLGAWPLGPLDVDDLTGRLREYLTKALREAKQHTSWLDPDEAHEAAVIALAERSVAGGGRLFNETFGPLFDDVAFHGACNSLAQVVVKLALPGVADVYQGTELWDFSLVDPDNRRPVDYEARRAMLARDDAVLDEWRSGAVKLFVTSRSLHARRAQPELFVDGEFVPLAVVGAHAANVVAFARRRDDEWAVAVVPRCTTQVTRAPRFPLGDDVWADTAVVMPEAAPAQWRNVFGGPTVSTAERLPVARAFATLPVALMVPTARS